MSYKVRLDLFEGPLDLLIYLVKKDDIEIKDIPITQITEQYMDYIEMMQMLDLDIVGDFLVMAATLMQIKSKMLLPPDPTEEEPEDPRDELVQRLTEYQKFKEIADALQDKELARRDLFSRIVNEQKIEQLKNESKETYFESNLFDLINALSEALKKMPEDVLHEIVKEEFTVEQKIHDLLHLMLDSSSITLKNLFEKFRSKVEAIVTFLAVLELIRLKEIRVVQQNVFGDIEILRNTDNMKSKHIQEDNFQDNAAREHQDEPREPSDEDEMNNDG